jgi:hypothetical protein
MWYIVWSFYALFSDKARLNKSKNQIGLSTALVVGCGIAFLTTITN